MISIFEPGRIYKISVFESGCRWISKVAPRWSWKATTVERARLSLRTWLMIRTMNSLSSRSSVDALKENCEMLFLKAARYDIPAVFEESYGMRFLKTTRFVGCIWTPQTLRYDSEDTVCQVVGCIWRPQSCKVWYAKLFCKVWYAKLFAVFEFHNILRSLRMATRTSWNYITSP